MSKIIKQETKNESSSS